MSFDPSGGHREVEYAKMNGVVRDASLMSERTHLPELDYGKLAIARLGLIRKADQVPQGRYAPLVAYLKQRGSMVDAAEVDRRLRTWFDDIITKLIAAPQEWDAERTLDGKALMDFLSGIQSAPAQAPAAPAPRQPGGPA